MESYLNGAIGTVLRPACSRCQSALNSAWGNSAQASKTTPPLGQGACDQVDGINAESPDIALIVGVEMSHVMWGANFDKHTNDDTEEPAELRH